MKNRIKSFFTTNLGWKIGSLFAGIFIWAILNSTQDPLVTRIVNIPITYQNADTLLLNEKLVVLSSPETVPISVSVRRSNVNKLNPSLFTCTADLTDHNGAVLTSKRVHVNVTQVGGSDIVIDWDYNKNDPNVTVIMDNYIEKQFKILRLDEDVISEGLTMESYFDPETVTVSGPESHFASLASVKAVVNLQELSKDGGGVFNMNVKLGLYDSNNKLIVDDMLKLSTSEVTMRAIVSRMATIPVKLEGILGTPQTGFKYLSATVNPDSLLVYGLKSTISDVSEIRIPAEEVNIEGISEETVYTIDLSPYIPEGITVADGNHEVTVTVFVEALEVQEVSIPVSQIDIIGEDEHYDYNIGSLSVKVLVRGFKEDLQMLDSSMIPLSIDVTDLEVGSHSVKVIAGELSGYTYDNADSLQISLVVKEKPEETEESESETEVEGSEETNETVKETTAKDETQESATEESASEKETVKETVKETEKEDVTSEEP